MCFSGGVGPGQLKPNRAHFSTTHFPIASSFLLSFVYAAPYTAQTTNHGFLLLFHDHNGPSGCLPRLRPLCGSHFCCCMPAACLRAATTLCQGSHTSALRCLMTKVRTGDASVPQECSKALEQQLPARHKKQGAGGSRMQPLMRLLTESGSCGYTSNPACQAAACTVSGPDQCTNSCVCSSYVAAAVCLQALYCTSCASSRPAYCYVHCPILIAVCRLVVSGVVVIPCW